MRLLHKIALFLFDREPPPDPSAAAVVAAVDARIAAWAPSPPTFVPDPPAIELRTYFHAGKRFERLTEQQQEEAQARLFRRLKARQREIGIQWDTFEVDMGARRPLPIDWDMDD